MQRFKKPFLWLTLLSLMISLLPVGLLTPKASAANTNLGPTHFIPSIQELKKTFSLVMESKVEGKEQITRSNVYHVTTPTLDIEGSYKSGLSSTGMTVLVERLVLTNSNWVPDKTNVYSNGITALTGNTFKAGNVTLFEGFNRITFSGILGGSTKSESFYVLYDKVPYLEELMMYDGGSLGTPLNEGTPVITAEAMVSLEGKAQNANTITISVNGKNSSSVPRDEYSGKFYVSGLSLSEGTNDVQILITNGSDTITMNRSIFRVSDTQKVSSLFIYNGAAGTTAYDAFNKTPLITDTWSNVNFIAQVIIPYDHHKDVGTVTDLKNLLSAEYKKSGVDTSVNLTIDQILKMKPLKSSGLVDDELATDATKEVVVSDANGDSKYFIVTFSASAYVPEVDKLNQLSLTVKYGTSFETSIPVSFKYSPGKVTIKNMYHLPSFSEPALGETKDIDEYTKLNLNGASVSSGTFYVLIETNTPTNALLDASYLPRGSKKLEIEPVNVAGITLKENQYLYKIKNFFSGQQQLAFRFGNGEESRATVSYITMTKIAFTNLVYGQTYSVDSKKDTDMVMRIEGEFLGFENFVPAVNASSSINGENIGLGDANTRDKVYFEGSKFTVNATIGSNGPLYFGENRIVFYGTSRDGNGNARTVTGELLVYIVDVNGSNINNFQPEAKSSVLLPSKSLMDTILTETNDDRLSAAQKEYDQIIDNLFIPSPTFTYDQTADAYTTNNKSSNLIARGGGATRVKLNFGSTNLINEELRDTVSSGKNDSFSFDFGSGTKTYKYYIVGSEKEFVLRVEGLDIEVPGTYVFNLELINDSGSRTSKKLEIVRVVEPFRLLAPQPNLDGQYIVNKNFVRFDIEAEGATKVLIDKYEAVPRQEAGMKDRFIYDYVGLKPDKATKIKIQIVRADTTYSQTIEVYYTSTVNIDSQFMAEKVATKYSVFNKRIELSFPKGTIMQTAFPGTGAIDYYPDNKILFGIADPEHGVVGKRDDYGNYIVGGRSDNTESGYQGITVPTEIKRKFTHPDSRFNFTSISNIYWIHGGLGDSGEKASTNGLQPYSLEGSFTSFPVDRKIVPSQRGKLKLAYDSNVVDDAGTTITVFRYTDSGIWENIGGEVDAKSHTIAVPFDDFGYYMVMKLRRGYDDITNHGWARNILNALYAKGIMKNLRGDSFGTDDRITRGEFATLLVKGLNIPLNYPTDQTKSTFTDVGPGAATETWSYKYIETAARAGIVTGTKEGEFAPYTPITREQASVMIARALKLKLPINDDKLNSALAKSFTDSGSMDYYARPSIQAVSKAKIMNGTASTLPGQKKPSYSFNPKGYMTRAEAGKIAVELFKKSTAIFPKNFN